MAPEEAVGQTGRRKKRRIESPIKELREHFGFSREQLARELNISFFTLRSWEQGVTRPSPEGRRRIRNAFIAEAMKIGMERKRAVLWVMERLVPVPGRASKDS